MNNRTKGNFLQLGLSSIQYEEGWIALNRMYIHEYIQCVHTSSDGEITYKKIAAFMGHLLQINVFPLSNPQVSLEETVTGASYSMCSFVCYYVVFH